MTRRYEITFLNASAQIEEVRRQAPALPVFEDAFGALGHGAILQTENGPISVEDLLPGDRIKLSDGRFNTLLWRGAITIQPQDHAQTTHVKTLIRITADALGPQRPSPDLILGPTARLYHEAAGIKLLTGSKAAFVPARDFVDGTHFVELRPAAPVKVYQLGFAGHERINVNGLDVETLHPGTAFSLGLKGDALVQFMSLFPHKNGWSDFGTLQHPRLRLRDLELLEDRNRP